MKLLIGGVLTTKTTAVFTKGAAKFLREDHDEEEAVANCFGDVKNWRLEPTEAQRKFLALFNT
jgi:hypothetical protein